MLNFKKESPIGEFVLMGMVSPGINDFAFYALCLLLGISTMAWYSAYFALAATFTMVGTSFGPAIFGFLFSCPYKRELLAMVDKVTEKRDFHLIRLHFAKKNETLAAAVERLKTLRVKYEHYSG